MDAFPTAGMTMLAVHKIGPILFFDLQDSSIRKSGCVPSGRKTKCEHPHPRNAMNANLTIIRQTNLVARSYLEFRCAVKKKAERIEL
jgi:hypothetical protein